MRRAPAFLALASLLSWPAVAAAFPREFPRAVLHAPRGQQQDGGLLSITCFTPTGGGVADAFRLGWPPVRIQPGRPLLIRFERPGQPSNVEILGPRGPIDFSLMPFAPAGAVVAWDARFAAPGPPPRAQAEERDGKRFYRLIARAEWFDEPECSEGMQVDWAFSLKRREPSR